MKIKTHLEIVKNIDSANINWLDLGEEWTIADITFDDDAIEYEVIVLREQYFDMIEQYNLNEFTMDKLLTNNQGDPTDVVQDEYVVDSEEIMIEKWAFKYCLKKDLPFAITGIYLPKMREDLRHIQKEMDGMAQTLIDLCADEDVDYNSMTKFDEIIGKL
jgi:hypothetical protein